MNFWTAVNTGYTVIVSSTESNFIRAHMCSLENLTLAAVWTNYHFFKQKDYTNSWKKKNLAIFNLKKRGKQWNLCIANKKDYTNKALI